MTSLPITSVFNDGYIAELFEQWRRSPESVDESWRQFFAFAQSLGGGAAPGVAADAAYLRKVAGAAALMEAIRKYGHLAVALDPLGIAAPERAPELVAESHGVTEEELAGMPALHFAGMPSAAAEVAQLRAVYSSTIGFEFEHIEVAEERAWLRQTIEAGEMRRTLTPDEKTAVLRRLTQVDGLERFLALAYQGAKRFSIEGTDALVPMLDAAIETAGAQGAERVVIGMAHRGRINVLAHILDKPYGTLFEEFEGKHANTNAASDTGDVKYHLGRTTERTVATGEKVSVTLVPNPSHLEFVNPILAGMARALQRRPDGSRDERAVLPVVIHGDAAFPGEGVVAESFNLSALRGYRVGGTLHIIVNNQVGFTTDPGDARSTYYASDLAKGFEVPIVHVNADDAESCVAAVWLALAYREQFGKDFLIDLVGYRRWGHNEQDEPMYTQPTMYERVKAHPRPREVWARRLATEGVLPAEQAAAIDREVQEGLARVHDEVRTGHAHNEPHEPGDTSAAPAPEKIVTAVKAEQLAALNERMLAWPSDFKPLPKLARQLERRRTALAGDKAEIDWGHAEALAWASLLSEGMSVRLSGQDAERGTFSHRQAMLHDATTGKTWAPLAHVAGATGRFEIYNSPLSETAVMGFEYGFSVAAPDTLVLWEAQFGDFVNVAQPVIDQFLAADRAKWGQDSGIVLLLPHGYEGQGPEHSSARLERFLQLSAEGNMRVAYPSTPSQYFHVIRRQAKLPGRRPLVLMQPKSLLRLPDAMSRSAELTGGAFHVVIDDAAVAKRRADVKRLVFTSGKFYYDLAAARGDASHVALVRVEELYPWPRAELERLVDGYEGVEEVVWAQEEPRNMGAWSYAEPRLRATVGNRTPIRYIGRPERASPAEGYKSSHDEQQARLVAEALAPTEGQGKGAKRTKAGARG